MKTQEKQEFLYLHVFVVPLELWLDKYRTAYNNVVLESPSVGFIRIPPKTPLFNIREFIHDQLDNDMIPVDFIFLRSVGRCLAVVNKSQEMKMKINEFVPPATYSPELFLLPCKHEDVSMASETVKEEIFYDDLLNKIEVNSDESLLESNDDVPFSSLLNNGMAVVQTQKEINNNNNIVMSAVPDGISSGGTPKIGIYKKNHHNSFNLQKAVNNSSNPAFYNGNLTLSNTGRIEKYSSSCNKQTLIQHNSLKNTNPSFSNGVKDIKAPTRPSPASTAFEDNVLGSGFKPDRHSLVITPVSCGRSLSPMVQQIMKPEIALILATPMVNFPLPSAQIGSRSSRIQQNIDVAKSQEILSREDKGSTKGDKSVVVSESVVFTNIDDEKGVEIMANLQKTTEYVVDEADARRSALEARVKARFEKENKRLEGEKVLDKNISQQAENELLEQMHELRKKNGTAYNNGIGNGNQALRNMEETNEEILSKIKEIGDAKKRKSDEKKLRELKNEQQDRIKMEQLEEKKKKLDELKKSLELAKTEKHAMQRVREVNGRKNKNLQAELNNRNVQKQNVWKKKYEEEKKQTVELEDVLKKLKSEVEEEHRRLVSHSSSLHTRGVRAQRQTKGAPSERSNQKNMVLRLNNDIEELKMMIELTKTKLTAESKMKLFAVQELKDLRTKALESKINASKAKRILSPQTS